MTQNPGVVLHSAFRAGIDEDLVTFREYKADISARYLAAKSAKEFMLPKGIDTRAEAIIAFEREISMFGLLPEDKLEAFVHWFNVFDVLEELLGGEDELSKVFAHDLPDGWLDFWQSILQVLNSHQLGNWMGLRLVWVDREPSDGDDANPSEQGADRQLPETGPKKLAKKGGPKAQAAKPGGKKTRMQTAPKAK